MILKRIKPLYFFIAFAVGLVAVYYTTPPPVVVTKFPSPYNAGKVNYRSVQDDNLCYTYRASSVACPLDQSLIRKQPV